MSESVEFGGGEVDFEASVAPLTWDTHTAVGVLALAGLGLLVTLRRVMPTP